MIKSFRHEGLEELFRTGSSRKVQAKHGKRLRLHPLKGKQAGYFAVDVDENFRVTFAFEAGHAVEVNYGDYH